MRLPTTVGSSDPLAPTSRHRPASAVIGLCLGLMACLSACGDGSVNRPVVIDTWPAASQALAGGLGAVRIAFDESVTLLNANAVTATGNGISIPVRLLRREDDPAAVYVLPQDTVAFPTNASVLVTLIQGAIVNGDRQYILDPYELRFTTGPRPPFYVGRSGVVTPLDGETFTAGADVPTPAGQDARGIVDTEIGGVRRVWVQLENGDGTGDALAWFTPGAAAMSLVTLTNSGGDLTAPSRAIAQGPNGRFLYVAFRDETAQAVRVSQVRLDTAVETGTLLLSIASGGATQPRGLAVDPVSDRLLVSADDGATGQLAQVDLLTLLEVDRVLGTPGLQAQVLAEGAGPLTVSNGQAMVTPLGGTSASLVEILGLGFQTDPNDIAGLNIDTARSRDRAMRVQALDSYAGEEGLVVRTVADTFPVPLPVVISDNVGGAATGAGGVQALGIYPFENRFLVILDNDVAARFVWTGFELLQEDLDDVTAGVQSVDLSTEAPGIIAISEATGALPAIP